MKKSINAVLEVPVGKINLKNYSIINSGYILKPACVVRAELGGPDIYRSFYRSNKNVRQINLKRRG